MSSLEMFLEWDTGFSEKYQCFSKLFRPFKLRITAFGNLFGTRTPAPISQIHLGNSTKPYLPLLLRRKSGGGYYIAVTVAVVSISHYPHKEFNWDLTRKIGEKRHDIWKI